MKQLAYPLIIALLISTAIAHAAPITLSVSISDARPLPGADFAATVVAFDGAGDVAVSVDLPAGLQLRDAAPLVLHATPVGLVVVHLHVASDAAVGLRVLVFRAGGRVVAKQIYVGIFVWPAAQIPLRRLWLPMMRR